MRPSPEEDSEEGHTFTARGHPLHIKHMEYPSLKDAYLSVQGIGEEPGR